MPVDIKRRALIGLGLMWLGGVRAFAAGAAVDVIGVWSTLARTGKHGESGDQMIITGREAILTESILFDSRYEIDGTKIKMTPMDERHGPPEAFEFTVEGNRMTTVAADAKPRVMTRVHAPYKGAHPIVGDWTFPLLLTWNFTQRFSRRGAAQLALPLEMDKGPYRLEGETMHIALARKPPLALTVRREGNLLITRGADGKETRYARFEY
jgi:hypothetical protein